MQNIIIQFNIHFQTGFSLISYIWKKKKKSFRFWIVCVHGCNFNQCPFGHFIEFTNTITLLLSTISRFSWISILLSFLLVRWHKWAIGQMQIKCGINLVSFMLCKLLIRLVFEYSLGNEQHKKNHVYCFAFRIFHAYQMNWTLN